LPEKIDEGFAQENRNDDDLEIRVSEAYHSLKGAVRTSLTPGMHSSSRSLPHRLCPKLEFSHTLADNSPLASLALGTANGKDVES